MNFSNTSAYNKKPFLSNDYEKSSKVLKLNVFQTFCKCWYCSSEICLLLLSRLPSFNDE